MAAVELSDFCFWKFGRQLGSVTFTGNCIRRERDAHGGEETLMHAAAFFSRALIFGQSGGPVERGEDRRNGLRRLELRRFQRLVAQE